MRRTRSPATRVTRALTRTLNAHTLSLMLALPLTLTLTRSHAHVRRYALASYTLCLEFIMRRDEDVRASLHFTSLHFTSLHFTMRRDEDVRACPPPPQATP